MNIAERDVGMSDLQSGVSALLADLRSSPEACHLIGAYDSDSGDEAAIEGLQSIATSEDFVNNAPSVSDVVETTRTMFERCRLGNSGSADLSLAMKGAADAKSTAIQVHRYASSSTSFSISLLCWMI